jgi:hypothetical protein
VRGLPVETEGGLASVPDVYNAGNAAPLEVALQAIVGTTGRAPSSGYSPPFCPAD